MLERYNHKKVEAYWQQQWSNSNVFKSEVIKQEIKYIKKGGNLKDFHEKIMRIGPCPIDALLDYFIEYEINK